MRLGHLEIRETALDRLAARSTGDWVVGKHARLGRSAVAL